MNLPVLSTEEPWYSAGLKFTCSQCGNCCTGGPGFVWISDEEIARLADHLKITTVQVLKKYCRKVAGKISLNESRNPSHGGYDCVFLTERKGPAGPNEIAPTIRGCSIYPVRPLQCRTWPFWDQNLSSPAAWDHSTKKCHGMNHGEHFDLARIQALKNAREWPEKAPTSKRK